jgi:hypothetical protein
MSEAPAKRCKLAPRELELLDLDDDVLIGIFDKLNHKSKIQLMLTCKRFEGLIGNTFQFFKYFKLSLNEQMIEPHYCQNIQRKFGIVKIIGSSNRSYQSQVFEIIKNIGEKIATIDMTDMKIRSNCTRIYIDLNVSDADFLKLMRFMPNLRELSISGWKIETSIVQPADADFQLTRLKSLTCNVDLGSLTALIPSSLSNFKYYCVDGSSVADILARQEKLVNLSLLFMKIDVFEYHSNNCRIKKLEIHDLVFPVKSEFQKFSNFMKIQECRGFEFHYL